MRRVPLGVLPKRYLKRRFQKCLAAWGSLVGLYVWFVPISFGAWQDLGVTPYESHNLATATVLGLIFLLTSAGVQVGDCWHSYRARYQPRPERPLKR